VMLTGTLWAGVTESFQQLLASVCLIGLAEGFSSSAVCFPPSIFASIQPR
jgi:hypothetical protein